LAVFTFAGRDTAQDAAMISAMPVGMLGLATAVPPYRLDQTDVQRFAERVYARS
jgi:hypothetical protein